MARTLLSIASAPGWNARFADDDEVRAVALAAWAVVEEEEEGGARTIVGIVQRRGTAESPYGSLQPADEVPGFQGYTFTGLLTKDEPPI
jgi:hypothetical protein